MIFKPTDVVPQLTRLILENRHVERWVFKIDGDIGGRGIAYFDLIGNEPISKLIREPKPANSGEKTQEKFTGDIYEEVQRSLSKLLPKKLIIVKPGVYKDYFHFIDELCKRGGVIESSPSSITKEVNSIGVLFQLDADGEVEIQTTYERIVSSPFSPAGFRFPQKILPNLNVSCYFIS